MTYISGTVSNNIFTASSSPWSTNSLIGQWAYTVDTANYSTGIASIITSNTNNTLTTLYNLYPRSTAVSITAFNPKTTPYSYSYSSATSDYGGDYFSGCCIDSQNHLWLSPATSKQILKIDIATGNQTVYAHNQQIGGTGGSPNRAFGGCCFDGTRVWFTPYNSLNIMSVDTTNSDAIALYAHNRTAVRPYFAGSCCFDGSRVWFAPHNSVNIMNIFASSGATAIYAHGDTGMNYKYQGCCWDGTYIWFAPHNVTNIMKCDTSGNVYKYPYNASNTGAYSSCCLDNIGYVWFAPTNVNNIMCINTSNNNRSYYSESEINTNAYFGCCADSNGTIWCSPEHATDIITINSNNLIQSAFNLGGAGNFEGCCFDNNNKCIWFAPLNAPTILRTNLYQSYFNNGPAGSTGTAAAGTAPLKFTTGSNLSAIENGTFEFDGDHLYFTISGVRKTII